MGKRVEIHFLEEPGNWEGFTAISGFKGFGAVGLISVQYVVEKLSMKRVGIITTRYHPEYVFRDDGGLAFPFEIYESTKHKVVAIVTREIPDERIRMEYVWKITSLLKDKGVQRAILVGGLDSRYKVSEEDRMRWLKNSHCNMELDAPLFEKGLLIVGPLALQLMIGEIIGLPMLVLLPYAKAEAPDPAAASIAVEHLNKLLRTNIDVSDLMREAARIQEELSKLEELVSKELSHKSVKEPYI